MHPDTRQVAEHLRDFGMAVLGRAAYDLTFSELMRPFAHLMAVGQAAQGAELVIKARVAQEHPLLLFSALPKSAHAEGQLTIHELYEYGRTIQYNELPRGAVGHDRYSNQTGRTIPELREVAKRFDSFRCACGC